MSARRELCCGKFSGKNNFPQDMVYELVPDHTIYGVIPMTAYLTSPHTKSGKKHCNLLLLLLFLTGVLLGCLLVWRFQLGGVLFGEGQAQTLFLDRQRFGSVFLWNAKFLLVIFLLSFSRLGALLIPPLFGVEGLLLGMLAGCITAEQGIVGAVCLGILLFFRLLLVLPYGFLLGAWAVEQSLRFDAGDSRGKTVGILLVTLVLLFLSAFLECTLARWLGGMYFVRFGVS